MCKSRGLTHPQRFNIFPWGVSTHLCIEYRLVAICLILFFFRFLFLLSDPFRRISSSFIFFVPLFLASTIASSTVTPHYSLLAVSSFHGTFCGFVYFCEWRELKLLLFGKLKIRDRPREKIWRFRIPIILGLLSIPENSEEIILGLFDILEKNWSYFQNIKVNK